MFIVISALPIVFLFFKVLKRAREFDKNAVDRTGQILPEAPADSRAAGKAVLHEGEYLPI